MTITYLVHTYNLLTLYNADLVDKIEQVFASLVIVSSSNNATATVNAQQQKLQLEGKLQVLTSSLSVAVQELFAMPQQQQLQQLAGERTASSKPAVFTVPILDEMKRQGSRLWNMCTKFNSGTNGNAATSSASADSTPRTNLKQLSQRMCKHKNNATLTFCVLLQLLFYQH